MKVTYLSHKFNNGRITVKWMVEYSTSWQRVTETTTGKRAYIYADLIYEMLKQN
jgi:hypothetical protein